MSVSLLLTTNPLPLLGPCPPSLDRVPLTSLSSCLSTWMPTTLGWMVGSSGASTEEGK